MSTISQDAELLGVFVSALFSLFLSYFPKVNIKWDALESKKKSTIVLLVTVAITATTLILSCAKVSMWIPCNVDGFKYAVTLLLWNLFTSQATYMVSPTSRAVKSSRLTRAIDSASTIANAINKELKEDCYDEQNTGSYNDV